MIDKIFGKNNQNQKDDGEHWLSVADLMSGLMIVFLFISIVFMRNASLEHKKVKDIAKSYQNNKLEIYNALTKEFQDDLKIWDAEIDPNSLSFNFKSPDILFDVGKSTLKVKFKNILNDFFPRYLAVISQFKSSIEEVRIEGHTSSLWNSFTSTDNAYFKNMKLSQNRTRSVLYHTYNISDVAHEKDWIKKNIAAVGYSSSKLIKIDGVEDSEQSRRVSFKIVTNSENKILKILEDT